MWRALTASERAKFAGTLLLSGSLVAMAAAIGYFGYVISEVQQQVPVLLQQTGDVSAKIDPVLQQLAETRDLIPPILDEVAAVRLAIPPIVAELAELRRAIPPVVTAVVDEVAAVREQLPPVLAEVAATRKALPPMLATAAKSVHEASSTVLAVEPHIAPALDEIRQTRESLPELMGRAETLVASAKDAGQEATEGAVKGVFTSIIKAPFNVIGGVGHGLANQLGLEGERGFTDQDASLASEATDQVIRAGKVGGEASWSNPDNNNRGVVKLLGQGQRGDQHCYQLRQTVIFAYGRNHQAQLEFCQNSDGSWSAGK